MSVLFNQTNINATTAFFETIGSGTMPISSFTTLSASSFTVSSINGVVPGGGSVVSSFTNLYTSTLTVSSINGAVPGGGSAGLSLVFWADQTNTVTDNALSVVSQYSNVIINNGITINSNGTSNASLTLSQTGSYLFEVSGWYCGSGNTLNRVVATRAGNTVYDRRKAWGEIGCGVGSQKFYWDGFQSGDVIQVLKNVNNGGTFTSNTSNSATSDEWGSIAIYKQG